MKLLLIFLTLLSYKGCAQTENTEITYNAASRGFYYNVVVNKDNITVQKTRGSEKGMKMEVDKAKWEEISGMLKSIEIAEMENLKSDSSKSQVDAAAIANLQVKLDDENVHTATFDHGNPPEELKALVNAILSLAETVEKQ
ncbi:hypothetical protein ACJD0Z_00845 [Flavobacteriaceae bacterium M23B6Z8]